MLKVVGPYISLDIKRTFVMKIRRKKSKFPIASEGKYWLSRHIMETQMRSFLMSFGCAITQVFFSPPRILNYYLS